MMDGWAGAWASKTKKEFRGKRTDIKSEVSSIHRGKEHHAYSHLVVGLLK